MCTVPKSLLTQGSVAHTLTNGLTEESAAMYGVPYSFHYHMSPSHVPPRPFRPHTTQPSSPQKWWPLLHFIHANNSLPHNQTMVCLDHQKQHECCYEIYKARGRMCDLRELERRVFCCFWIWICLCDGGFPRFLVFKLGSFGL